MNACHSNPQKFQTNLRIIIIRLIHVLFSKFFCGFSFYYRCRYIRNAYKTLCEVSCGLKDALLHSFLFCCCNIIIKETDGKEAKEDVVAKIETTTDELKPHSGEKPKTSEIPEPSPSSEKEEPLFKSSLRVKLQSKPKVS